MRFIYLVKRLWQFPFKLKFLLIESLYYSFLNEGFLRFKIFRFIKPWLKNQEKARNSSPEDTETIRMVSRSMNLIEKYAPWKPKCYNRAITAKRILSKRKIETSIHIGFRTIDDELKGHAWVTLGGNLLTGFIKGINEYDTLEGEDFFQITQE